jgi:hypothetical protein
METEAYIGINDCINGNLYRIIARNARFGIFVKDEKCFIVSRFKFGNNYLDAESHWDTGAPYGTVQPLEDLGPVSGPLDYDETLVFLNTKGKQQ